MTFLNPLVLFGLVAAAVPVILHLLNLRKLKTVEFSTLTFLKELQQTKVRKLKIRQLLLLIIRTLLVIFIILIFARPALRGRMFGAIGTSARATVVLIIDDSFSLTAADERGDRLKQVKDAALRCTDLLQEGDEIFVIRLSDLPKVTVEPAMHDFSPVRTFITEMPPSSVRRPLSEALTSAARLFAQSNNAIKEIYIVSDFQHTLLAPGQERVKTPASLFDERVKIFLVPIGTRTIPNADVDSVEVRSKILEKNRPVRVFASFRNFSPIPLHDYVVSIFLGGSRAAQSNISAEAYGSASTEFTVTPKAAGDLAGYVEIENDAIEQDNRRYFLLRIPGQIRVAIVSDQKKEGDYLIPALRSASEPGDSSFMRIAQIGAGNFPLLDLRATDVLVCANVRSFSQTDVARIAEYVRGGGGLIIFPGDPADRSTAGASLVASLGIPAVDSVIHASAGQTLMHSDRSTSTTRCSKQCSKKKAAARSSRRPISLPRQSRRFFAAGPEKKGERLSA